MVALLGTNGLDVDLDGRLVFCAHGDRALGRMEADGTRTILADRFEGKRFNGPNDLVVKSDGSIYFTDLGAPLLGGFANSPDRELDFRGVFRWTSDGAVQLISRDLGNGIAFSPDEAHLYVTGAGVTRFDVMPDGSVTNGQVHVQRSADGVRVDAHGFLYGGGGGAASGSPVRTATCSALSERRIWRVTRSPTSRSGTPTARGCTSVRCAVCSMSGWNVRPGRSRGPTPASRSGSVRCGPEPLVQEPLDPLSVDAFAHIQVAA